MILVVVNLLIEKNTARTIENRIQFNYYLIGITLIKIIHVAETPRGLTEVSASPKFQHNE